MISIATNQLIAIFVAVFAGIVGTLIAVWIQHQKEKKRDRQEQTNRNDASEG